MRKYYLPTILFLLSLVLMMPVMVLATDEVSFTDVVNVYISDPGTTLKISPGSLVDQIEVDTDTVTFILSGNSTVTITSSDRYILTNTLGTSTNCGSSSSDVTLTGSGTVEVDPGSVCPTAVGGSAPAAAATPPAPPVPTQPTTTTGEVEATASEGGTTSVVSDEVTASVDVPAEAIAADTTVTITPTTTTETAVATAIAAVPSTKSVVGSKVYNYSATSAGAAVSTFDSAVSVSISYTDDQISGLQLSTLKIYYWNETTEAWVALASVVNTTDKTVTAGVTHFTYFVIMGTPEGVEEEEEEVEEVIEEAEEETEEEVTPISEMTITQLKAEITRIAGLIAELQVLLLEMIGEVEGCTITSFDKNLQLAMSGDDVKCLQIVLNSSADTQVAPSGVGSPGNETNYFGSLTEAAVVKFQDKYADEVLAPWGLSSGNGFVGPKTREKLNELF